MHARVSTCWHTYGYGGASSGLNGAVWTLVKPLRVNNQNQKHRGCPTRGTAVRRFEHVIIYKRWDDESKVRQEGSLLSFGVWEEAEKRVTMRRCGNEVL